MATLSRRDFLKSSALGAAGGVAGAMATSAASGEVPPAASPAATSPGAAAAASTPPAAATPSATYRFTREIPAEDGFDLVVAGGGPAGTVAAVCAARLGAKVLLLEATGCLGGMGTSGLVTAFDPMANGERMLAGGVMKEIVTAMHKRGFLAPHVTEEFYAKRFHCWTPFRVEGYKLILDELAAAAKVDVRFFTRVVEADAEASRGLVRGVVTHGVDGLRWVGARAFIDATGDAFLAERAGAACREAGRDTPAAMPATLCSLFAGIDWARAAGPGATGPSKQQSLLEKAIAAGHFTQPDKHLPGLYRVGDTVGMLNGGHVFRMNAVNTRSLSDGMMLGRRLAQEYVAFYRQYVPGCENAELAITAALMGVRESRRIVGEYELTFDDYMARRQFPDQVGVFNKAVDIHPYDNSPAEFQRYYKEYHQTGRLKAGECYGIPYGILVPRGWRNLWVAGRCNSSDVQVHGSIRVQPAAAMMGQAAGTAAVQSLATGQPACDLDTASLVETLRGQGAYLPQGELSAKMTRKG